MTFAEAIIKFDILIDKYGSPYFTTDEKYALFNMAQNEFLNRAFPDSLGGGVYNYEATDAQYQLIAPLIYELSLTPTVSLGVGYVPFSTIITNLSTASSDAAADIFLISAVRSAVDNTPIPFITPSKWAAINRNSFKATNPRYSVVRNPNEQLAVYNHTAGVVVSTVKTPKPFQASGSPDLSDYAMNQVINIAVALAMESTRDKDGTQIAIATPVSK